MLPQFMYGFIVRLVKIGPEGLIPSPRPPGVQSEPPRVVAVHQLETNHPHRPDVNRHIVGLHLALRSKVADGSASTRRCRPQEPWW